MKKSKQILSVFLAVLMIALSVPVAFAASDCPHSDLAHYIEGELRNMQGSLCVEHWRCYYCNKYFADETKQVELTNDEVFSIPCPHDSKDHYNEGVFRNSTGNRCVEHWQCNSCGKWFADEQTQVELTYDQLYSIPCPHDSKDHYNEGESGNNNGYFCVEHWRCFDCGKYFGDEQAQEELTYDQVYSIPCPHNKKDHYAKGERTNFDGYTCTEYYQCTTCYKYFADEQAQVELTYDQVYSIPCPHENLAHYKEVKPFCGGTGKREYYLCTKCWKYFADEKAQQELEYDQLTITAPNDEHDFRYDVGFEDEGNDHVWLSATSSKEKEYQEEYGMTIAQKFASDGTTVKFCNNCGVVIIQNDGTEQRPESLSLFVNPIPELAGAVKIPTSPKGLSVGEKWLDIGSFINLGLLVSDLPDEDAFSALGLLMSLTMDGDYYFNEKTQKLFELSRDLINEATDIQESKLIFAVRTIGEDVNTTTLQTTSSGLKSGQKWFDAVSFYRDATAQYVPKDEKDRAEFESFLSQIVAAEFSLSADKSKVFTKGRNEQIAKLIENIPAEEQNEEMASIHNGSWFIGLNDVLQSLYGLSNTLDASDYVKTVEGDCAHVWNNGKETKSATCTSAGTKIFSCTLCGDTREEIIPALGHAWDGGVITKEPTETDTGLCIYTCTRCKTTKTSTVPRLDPAPLLDDLKNKKNLKDTVDDATVFFDPEANLPANTVFDYEIITQSTFFQIFDLTLTSDGKKVEPEAPVWVKLPIPKGWNPNWISVWHGNEKLPSFADGGYVYFLTTHFSEFQVKYEGQNENQSTQESETQDQSDTNACKLCGEVHTGLFGALVGFFHRIIYFFKHLFG